MSANTVAPPVARWRVVGAKVLMIVLPCGFAAIAINLALGAPGWSQAATCAAALAGAIVAIVIFRMPPDRKVPGQNGWLSIAFIGALGPILGGAPDRIAVIPLAFMVTMLAAGLWIAEARRTRLRRTG